MKKIMFALGMFCFGAALGQEIPNLAPPTPEAASLERYDEVPVGHYRGVPNINVPIAQLKTKGIQIPISLSYHAGGIRVSEVAPRVGLGWNISTGGMISRQVRGIPDDYADGYINTNNKVDDYFAQSQTNRIQLFEAATISGTQDYESDVYSFNFMGTSGKFYFAQNGASNDIIIHQKGDLRIQPLQDGNGIIEGWEITTANGMQYSFGIMSNTTDLAVERKTQQSYAVGQALPPFNNASMFNFISSWHLTQIKDTNGNVVDYTYTINSADSQKVTYWDVVSHSREFVNGLSNGCPVIDSESLILTQNTYTPVFLSKIEGDNGRIEFDYGLARQDLINDFALTSVKTFNSANTLISEYEFSYDYFMSADPGVNYGQPMITAQRDRRLYLTAVEEVMANQVNKIHTFDYYTDHILPQRLSFSQDFWGYYNGQDNDELYPEVELSSGSSNYTIPGGDRKVYQNFVNACTLKSITYPTKGKTEFVFESNTLTGEEGFFIGTQFQTANIPGGFLANATGNGNAGATFTSNFTLTTDFPYNEIVDYSITAETNCNASALDCPSIQIFEADGTTVITTLDPVNGASGSLNLSDGNYVLKITNGFLQTTNNVSIRLQGRQLLPNQGGNALTGGLRVQEIRFKDDDGTLLKKHSYEYHLFNCPTMSSGLAQNPPTYVFFNIPDDSNNVPCSKNRLSSSPIFPLNGQSASHVGYRNVTEIIDDGSEGRIEYEFRFDPDSQSSSTNRFEWGNFAYPTVPSFDFSHRRGLPTKKRIYKNGSNTPLEIMEYEYDGERIFTSENIGMATLGNYNGAETYSNQSERYYKNREITTRNENGGTISTTTDFDYDAGYSGRSFPTTVETTDSEGKRNITETFYPDDVTSTSTLEGPNLSSAQKSAIDRLKEGDLHRVAEPIQAVTTVRNGNTLLSQSIQRTNYQDRGSSIVVPASIQTLKGTPSGSNAIQNRVIFQDYDDKGNPLEVSRADGPPISYIWGYDKEYPVAKVENATRTQIEALSGFGNNFHTGTGGLTQAQENQLRGLANTLVTTYTYKPLVGVTSMTDTRGYTMYYEYDNFNRLIAIKDTDNNLITDYEYHYLGQ